MPKTLPFLILLTLSLLSFARPANAITLGQVDDFQSADPLDRMNWLNGASTAERVNGGGPLGAGDNYLRLTADGGGQGGRLVAQNYNNPFNMPPIVSQWTGNYIPTGVTSIELDLINQGTTTLSVRIAFKADTSQGSPGYLSSRVILAPGSGWQHFTIPITAANLVPIGGPAAYNVFFQNGFQEIRIINEAGTTNLNGDPVVGQLGIDNIRASSVTAVSRKTHGGAGVFDIPLPLTGTPGVEPRTTSASNDYEMVVTHPAGGTISVSGSPQAQVTAGSATIGTGGVSNGGAVSISSNTITIPLTNVTNAQTIAVTLNSVSDGTTTRAFTIPMSVVIGDVNGSGGVSSTDVAQTKLSTSQALSSANFRTDVNASGATNASDVAIVKSRTGQQLPGADATKQ